MEDKLQQEVLDTIDYIKNVHQTNNGDPMEVFRNGNCGNIYTFLSKEFPEKAIPCGIYRFRELLHIITKIEDKYYDISGEVTLEKYIKYLLETNEAYSSNPSHYVIEEISIEKVESLSNNYKAITGMRNSDKKTARKIIPSPEDGNMVKIQEALDLRRKNRTRENNEKCR